MAQPDPMDRAKLSAAKVVNVLNMEWNPGKVARVWRSDEGPAQLGA